MAQVREAEFKALQQLVAELQDRLEKLEAVKPIKETTNVNTRPINTKQRESTKPIKGS